MPHPPHSWPGSGAWTAAAIRTGIAAGLTAASVAVFVAPSNHTSPDLVSHDSRPVDFPSSASAALLTRLPDAHLAAFRPATFGPAAFDPTTFDLTAFGPAALSLGAATPVAGRAAPAPAAGQVRPVLLTAALPGSAPSSLPALPAPPMAPAPTVLPVTPATPPVTPAALSAAAPAAPVLTKGASALSAAMGAMGTPYRWGGTSTSGFDCSGLMFWSFKKAGITLPRTSAAQSAVGTPVSRSELRPGDLVFFYRPVSHVGIYVGDGKVLHAPQSGDVVKISPIDRMPFASARRF